MATANARDPANWGGLERGPLLVLVVGVVFLLAVTEVTTPDTFVHLSLGRWMAEHGRLPTANLLSFTQPERPAMDHEWLFQAGLYAVWRAVGVCGATLLKAALVAAAFGLALATAFRKGSGLLVAAFVTLVAAAAARFRFTLRPQVVAFFLLSVYLYCLERWRQGKPRGLLALVPLQALWANVHGSAVVGCALMLACAAAESLRHLALRTSDSKRQSAICNPQSATPRHLLWLWGVAVALPFATMLNPNGVSQLTFPFSHAAAQSAMGLKELLQDRASIRWADLTGRHVFFTLLAVGGLASLVGWWVRRDITEAGLFAGLLWAAAHSERFIELFAVAAAPIVAANLCLVLRAPLARLREVLDRRARGTATTVLAALALGVLGFVALEATSGSLPFGFGLAPGFFPEAEVAWIQQHRPDGNLFNEFEHGGYVYWTARRPVFLDSRGMPAYDPAFVRDYVDAWTVRERWRALLDAHDISVALVERRPLRHMFDTDDGWSLAREGAVFSVYVRNPR